MMRYEKRDSNAQYQIRRYYHIGEYACASPEAGVSCVHDDGEIGRIALLSGDMVYFSMLMDANIMFLESGAVTSPAGFFAGATYAGIKKKSPGALDLALLYSESDADAAAVFTTNRIKAAPVIVDQNRLEQDNKVRAVVVNSGCANACTGDKGIEDALQTIELAARYLGIPAEKVLVASTGVIGVRLPLENIRDGIERIALTREGGHHFTRAIMTTDTRPKECAVRINSEGVDFVIGGTAKGAGMIHPNMATMLGFLTTDAAVDVKFLKKALKVAVDDTFNMVSVDGDTSTNDTVLILANGRAGNSPIREDSKLAGVFQEALNQVCLKLAKGIAADGEGATRLIEVQVKGALSLSDARLVARTIASSPLVKTAVHGCDPNWGRVVAAAGRSGAEVEQDKINVYFGDLCLLKSGTPQQFEKTEASKILRNKEVIIRVDLNLGQASAVAWGCDLSEEYVVINSEYTT